jgi:arsenical pump membrane protein
MLRRPRNISEAWIAGAGGLVMLALGPLSLADARAVSRETADVLFFLLGMMVLTTLAEQAGIFDFLAEGCARLAHGSGTLLFCGVFVLGAIVTAFLSLDVTVLILTPIIYALVIRRNLNALPFMFACTFVANTASLALPISNLTSLLVYDQLELSYQSFIARMWLPNLVAVVVNLGVFLWLFRNQIPRRYNSAQPEPLPPFDWWSATAALVLMLTLCGLFVQGFAHRPLAWAALAGGVALALIGIAGRRASLPGIARSVSWQLFIFVVGMLLVVRGLEQSLLDDRSISTPHGVFPAVLVSAGSAALGSNIVNNVPMTILALPLIGRATGESRQVLAFGTLVGANIGPTLTTYGSLATMLWLSLVRKRGLDVSTKDYLKVGLITMPPVLLSTSFTLWLVLR